jgi:hypothetical protein
MGPIDVPAILFLIAIFVVIVAVLFSLVWVGWKREAVRGHVCPYCGAKMQLGIDVARSVAGMVNSFLDVQPSNGNPAIDFAKAAYCPRTGRIFPNCVTTSEQVTVSWNFLQERCPGTYVSWGSLSEEERGVLKILHDSFDGFQTEKSSVHSRPEDVEEEVSSLSPGPLYVDRQQKILLGWKKVPGTYFEVLVVQNPRFQTLEETL